MQSDPWSLTVMAVAKPSCSEKVARKRDYRQLLERGIDEVLLANELACDQSTVHPESDVERVLCMYAFCIIIIWSPLLGLSPAKPFQSCRIWYSITLLCRSSERALVKSSAHLVALILLRLDSRLRQLLARREGDDHWRW